MIPDPLDAVVSCSRLCRIVLLAGLFASADTLPARAEGDTTHAMSRYTGQEGVVVRDTQGVLQERVLPIEQVPGEGTDAEAKSGVAQDDVDAASATVRDNERDVILDVEDLFIVEGDEESILAAEPAAPVVIGEEPQQTGDDEAGAAPVAEQMVEPLPHTDSARHDPVVAQPPPPRESTPLPDAVEAQHTPVVVEEVRSINFARNLEEYRSPRLAMLLSLIVPGAGQAYAGSYFKTVLFGAAELAIIGAGVGFNLKGRNSMSAARREADRSFDTTAFARYYDELLEYFAAEVYGDLADADSVAQSRMNSIFFQTDLSRPFVENVTSSARSKTDGYYAQIVGKEFVQGWSDAVPAFSDIRAGGPGEELTRIAGRDTMYFRVYDGAGADSAYLLLRSSRYPDLDNQSELHYGYSRNQERFSELVSAANQYYRRGTSVLFLLLVNHIGSALDAGITAKRHNDALLGKQSWWDRIHLEQQWVNTGREIAPGYALGVRF